MTQPQMGKSLDQLVQTAARIFEANGFQIVTSDDLLFPSIKPALAALKNGRLAVCLATSFTATDQFLKPDEVNYIRDELDTLIDANRPDNDQRVKSVTRVALVLVPGDITVTSPAGDIKWVVVESVDELPEEMDKIFGGFESTFPSD